MMALYSGKGMKNPPSEYFGHFKSFVAIGPYLCFSPWREVNKVLSSSCAFTWPLHGHSLTMAKFTIWPYNIENTKVMGQWPMSPPNGLMKWKSNLVMSGEELAFTTPFVFP